MKTFLTTLLCILTFIGYSQSTQSISSIWIISGHPGDQHYEQKYQQKIEEIQLMLTTALNVPEKSIHILFHDNKTLGKPCTKENVLEALTSVNKELTKGKRPLIIFLGHANTTPKDVLLNLPGEDISVKTIAQKLNSQKPASELGIIWSADSGKRAVKLLSRSHRVILAAVETEDRDNEPVLSEVIENMFMPEKVDQNNDHQISFIEMHAIAKAEVKKWYANQSLIQLESIVIEGNADGKGTAAPAQEDKQLANKFMLKY
ncbi:hypothetical protein EYV94_16260 [Puteibacter caeruleilacunae]|nr:hypothetical protein EYV94_16260 [Puteibacter caeruleilacunae]